jgi:FMN phosphatase YigB (HAD superfamily)
MCPTPTNGASSARYGNCPPHPDEIEGVTRLRDAGFRMAAVTNSTIEVAEAQMQQACLGDFFEQVLSSRHAKTPEARPRGLPHGGAASQR